MFQFPTKFGIRLTLFCIAQPRYFADQPQGQTLAWVHFPAAQEIRILQRSPHGLTYRLNRAAELIHPAGQQENSPEP